jgi:hypothetical protein
MAPLYVHYIEDHVVRLESLGREDLAASFRAWRDRFVG